MLAEICMDMQGIMHFIEQRSYLLNRLSSLLYREFNTYQLNFLLFIWIIGKYVRISIL